ncbi:hypothetical protein MUO66_10485 [Candidatus Bathyarchaeota archaeon]|nr:hypothetical protein [Candidatus Bathyarchaeota archaeon]
MTYVWNKPVLTFYVEKNPPEKEPFVVVKSSKLEINISKDKPLTGKIKDFFPLMGNLDCIMSIAGLENKYVICWFDDTVADFSLAFRRLIGVSFSSKTSFTVDKKGKKTYNAEFQALNGKIN